MEGLAGGGPDSLWYEVPEDYEALVTVSSDAALVGLLPVAMHQNQRLYVEGPVTDELHHNVTHGLMTILHGVFPDLGMIDVAALDPVPAGAPASGVATGFSGGIDSYSVLAEHLFEADIPASMKLSHLTFFNVGSHGAGQEGRAIFNVRYQRLTAAAEVIGLPLVKVDSNLGDFYPYCRRCSIGDFPRTHGPRTMSAALLLQEGIGRYLVASGYDYTYAGVRPWHDTAIADAIAIPLLATAAFRPSSHGSQYSRVQKTELVSQVSSSHTTLDVCTLPAADGRNCSHCIKCLRTLLTLEMLGCLGDYGAVFDLEVYARHRKAYLSEVAISRDPFLMELRELARAKNFPLPSVSAPRLRRAAKERHEQVRALGGRLLRRIGYRFPGDERRFSFTAKS